MLVADLSGPRPCSPTAPLSPHIPQRIRVPPNGRHQMPCLASAWTRCVTLVRGSTISGSLFFCAGVPAQTTPRLSCDAQTQEQAVGWEDLQVLEEQGCFTHPVARLRPRFQGRRVALGLATSHPPCRYQAMHPCRGAACAGKVSLPSRGPRAPPTLLWLQTVPASLAASPTLGTAGATPLPRDEAPTVYRAFLEPQLTDPHSDLLGQSRFYPHLVGGKTGSEGPGHQVSQLPGAYHNRMGKGEGLLNAHSWHSWAPLHQQNEPLGYLGSCSFHQVHYSREFHVTCGPWRRREARARTMVPQQGRAGARTLASTLEDLAHLTSQ